MSKVYEIVSWSKLPTEINKGYNFSYLFLHTSICLETLLPLLENMYTVVLIADLYNLSSISMCAQYMGPHTLSEI